MLQKNMDLLSIQGEMDMENTRVTQDQRQAAFTSMTQNMASSDMNSMSSLAWPPMQQDTHQVVHPLESSMILDSWNFDPFPVHSKLQQQPDWDLNSRPFQTQQQLPQPEQMMESYDINAYHMSDINFGFNNFTNSMLQSSPSSSVANKSGMITPPMTNYYQARRSLPTHLEEKRLSYVNNTALDINRRHSAGTTESRRVGKRASSNPSVASVVSLTAHEPVSKMIDGIEHITFLYSHDRLVKEYTVRTDVESVNLDEIPMDSRIQNAIYPRANVDKSEYDGNRWNYETTCNTLGWKLCWLNKEQLFGRRGLIQRAVDSYRNRKADMCSRRVTRQEKVANGTLRKRRSKKSLNML